MLADLALERNFLVSSTRGIEISIPVKPATRTCFSRNVADRLSISPQESSYRVYVRADGLPSLERIANIWLRPEDLTVAPTLMRDAPFIDETIENTLSALRWKSLFPSDYSEHPDVFVPLLGRAIWKQLVEKGDKTGQEMIVGIEVESGQNREFDDMLEALDWADSFGKQTVYFRRYAPDFWRIL